MNSLCDITPGHLSGIAQEEWEYTTYLLDLLEEKTGALAMPVVTTEDTDGLVGFALYANGRIICASPHKDGDSPSDSADLLGYLFFYYFGQTGAET